MRSKKVKIGSFLIRRKVPIEIKNSVEYKRITIRTKHQGILIRDTIKGSLIGTKLQFVVQKGQFLLSKIDARLGAFGIVPDFLDQGIITGNFWAFDVDKKKVNIDWFNLFTSSGNFYQICNQASSGTTHRKYLNEVKFLNFEINLPDLDEQNEFINKFEGYQKNFKNLKFEIEQQQSYLHQLRQSILQEAVQGKLTRQNKNDEPGEKLLQRIKAEKRKLVAQKKTKWEFSLHQKSKALPPGDLPLNWKWIRFWDAAWCYRGHNPPKSEFITSPAEGYVRFIQITDFKTNERATYVPISKGLKYVSKGEIIMAAYRHIGKVSREMEGAFNVALCKILNIAPYDRDFLELVIKSSFVKGELLAASERGHIPSMHSDHLLSLWIPLPPVSEQQSIVKKVNEFMKLTDKLEQQIERNKTYADQLLQSVLKESFGDNNGTTNTLIPTFDTNESDHV